MIGATKQQRVTILVVNGNQQDLEALHSVLGDEGMSWSSTTTDELLNLHEHCSKFDCVFVMVHNQEADLDTIANIRHHNPCVPIIALSSGWQVPTVVLAVKQGASEVCEFPGESSDLAGAFRRSVSPEARLNARFSDVIPKAILAKLTSEEARILHLLVLGRTTKEVGATLDVSIRTVHYRKKELLRKLGVQNRSEAIELIRLSTGNMLFTFGGDITAL